MATMEIRLTPAQQRKRRAEMEARVNDITRRRVEVADRLGLGVAVPGAVTDAELESLRRERAALEVELEELLDGLGVLRRATRS